MSINDWRELGRSFCTKATRPTASHQSPLPIRYYLPIAPDPLYPSPKTTRQGFVHLCCFCCSLSTVSLSAINHLLDPHLLYTPPPVIAHPHPPSRVKYFRHGLRLGHPPRPARPSLLSYLLPHRSLPLPSDYFIRAQ